MFKWWHMDPNQQPGQTPPQPQPQPGSQPAEPLQPPVQPIQPAQPYQPAADPAPPQTPNSYAAAQPASYDPNYLDSIAPPPPPPKFFSGSFGKIFFAMLGVFVLAVSLIVAFSGKDSTADLQQLAVRLDHMSQTAKTVQKNLKSNNLSKNNSIYQLWVIGSQKQAEDLLAQAGVKKSQYNKTMDASEKSRADKLDAKFEDARLNGVLDRVYASTMANETQQMINLFTTMSKASKAKAIRDYAKSTSASLVDIQKGFDSYTDDGN